MPEPFLIANSNILTTVPKAGGTVDLRPNGFAEAGSYYPCSDGNRLLHCTAGDQVVYVLFKRGGSPGAMQPQGVYQQNRASFAEAVRTGFADELAISLKGTSETIKNFLDVFMGALACAGGPLAWSITGMNIAVMGGQIKQNYKTYEDALVEIYAIRKTVENQMPTLYRTVLKNLLFGQLEKYLVGKSKDNLAEMIAGKKLAGKLVGVALGAFGEDHFKERLDCIAKLMDDVLIKVCAHIMDGKPALNETQIGQLADLYVIPIVAKVDMYPPSPADAREIIRETAKCWNMKTSFTRIAKGIKALK